MDKTEGRFISAPQVGMRGACALAQVFAPDGRTVATFEPTADCETASTRAALCAETLTNAYALSAEQCEMIASHLSLLQLAKRVFNAESGPNWKKNPAKAVEEHGAACDAFWNELRRQVDLYDDKTPEIESVDVLQKRLASRLRVEIVNTVLGAIEDAMNDMDLSGSGEPERDLG